MDRQSVTPRMGHFAYVPTEKELETILSLRREIADMEWLLGQKRNQLAEYHSAISAEFTAAVTSARQSA